MEQHDPERLVEDVGRRIGALRANRGATQEAFAEQLGVSLKYLQRIEAGRENLTIRSLAKIANLLCVPVSSLFETSPSQPRRRGRPPRGASE